MMKNKRKLFLGLIMLAMVFNFLLSFHLVSAADTIKFENPLSSNDEKTLILNITTSLRNVVVTLAILMIIVGGIMYMMSFGNDKALTRAKAVITAAVIGFAIVLGASTFLQEIWNILGVGGTVASPGGSSLSTIATNALNLLLSIVGVIGIIGIVIGGMIYMGGFSTIVGSGDSKKNVETGKKIITASIIGIVVCLSAVIIVQQIVNLI